MAAQADPPQTRQHGLSVSTQTVCLSNSPDTSGVIDLSKSRDALVNLLRLAGCAGARAEFNAWVENLGADYAESVTGGSTKSEDAGSPLTIQRDVKDNFRQVYVSYAIIVEPVATNGPYSVSFAASTIPPPADVKKPGWKILTPSFPLPQILNEGDQLPLLLTTYENRVQLVDYIHIGSTPLAKRTEAARDSYAEDSEFTLAQPKLRINGAEALPGVKFPESIRGTILWLYVPGQGRYIVSFLPHPEFGFSKVGEAGGDVITLIVNRNVLRVSGSDRIAPGGGVYNVYGALDPAWQPADPADRNRFMAGTSPAVESALPR